MRLISLMLSGTVLVLGSILSLSHSMVLAQDPRVGVPGGLPSPGVIKPTPIRIYHSHPAFHWIMVEAVQDDLKLSDKQKEHIKKASEAFDKKEQELSESRHNPSTSRPTTGNNQDPANGPEMENPEQRRQKALEHINRKDSLERAIDRTYSKILTRAQLARLKQIHYQYLGPFAIWDDPEVAQKLNIVEQQRLQLNLVEADLRVKEQGIRDQARAKADAIRNDQKLDDAERKKQLDQNRAKMLEQMSRLAHGRPTAYGRVLTRRQKELYKKILGEPFDKSKLTDWQQVQFSKYLESKQQSPPRNPSTGDSIEEGRTAAPTSPSLSTP